MNIYELKADYDKYRSLSSKGSIDYDLFNGTVVSLDISKIKLYTEDKNLEEPDIMGLFSAIFICNNKSLKVLKNYLEKEIQFIETSKKGYFLMNSLNVIDCLNKEKSELVKTSSGIITHVKKYVFDESKILKSKIFKIPEFKLTRIYATEEFKNIIENNNITGLKFNLI